MVLFLWGPWAVWELGTCFKMGFSDPEKGGKRKESNFTCFSAKSKNYLF
jgi:hypothetical protein